MPNDFDSWQYYEPETLIEVTNPFDEEGHKKAVALLAYRFAKAVVESYRAVNGEGSEALINEFYKTYLDFIKEKNKDPEIMRPIMSRPAFKLPIAEALDGPSRILFYCGIFMKAYAPIHAFQLYLENYRAHYLGLLNKQALLQQGASAKKKQREKIEHDKAVLADRIETCHLWINPLLEVYQSIQGILKLCMIAQSAHLLNVVMAYEDKSIHDLSFAMCLCSVVDSFGNLGFAMVENRLTAALMRETLARKIAIAVRAQNTVIDEFCRNVLDHTENSLVAEQQILMAVSKYNQWYCLIRTNPYSTIPITAVTNVIRREITTILNTTLPQIEEAEDRANYKKWCDFFISSFEFFSKEEPFTVCLMREWLTSIQQLSPYDCAAASMPHELMALIVKQANLFPRLLDGRINKVFPVNQIALHRLDLLQQVLNEITTIASINDIVVSSEVIALRQTLTERLEFIKRIIPAPSLLVSESTTVSNPKLMSELALLENARRKQEKELAQQARAKKSAQEAAKCWEHRLKQDTVENASTSIVLSPQELEIEHLFKAATQASNRFNLSESIALMEQAYTKASGRTKELAFLRLLHFRLQDRYNTYTQHVTLVMQRNQVTAPLVVPADSHLLTKTEEEALIAQQVRAKRIAATHRYFAETNDFLLGLKEWIASEQDKIKDQEIAEHIRYMSNNLLDFLSRVKDDCQCCNNFLQETGKYYKPYARSKNRQQGTSSGISDFAAFHNVTQRFFSVELPSRSAVEEEVQWQRFWQQETNYDETGIRRYTKADGTCVIQVRGHYDLYQLGKSLVNSTAGKKLYLVGGSVIRVLKSDVLLPNIELDLLTEFTEQEVQERLQDYFPYSIQHIANLLRIESGIYADGHDIKCSLNQSLAEDSLSRDFTRSAVYLELTAIYEETGCVEFIVHDPSGHGMTDIENKALRCINGDLQTTITTPERARRLLKALLQQTQLAFQRDREYVRSGALLTVLLSEDEATNRQINILYRKMLQEAGQAIEALAEDRYAHAARAELAWLLPQEALYQLTPHRLAEQVEQLIRKRILQVMVDYEIIPDHYLNDEPLLAAESFPTALTEKLQPLLPRVEESLSKPDHELPMADSKWDPKLFGASQVPHPDVDKSIKIRYRSIHT